MNVGRKGTVTFAFISLLCFLSVSGLLLLHLHAEYQPQNSTTQNTSKSSTTAKKNTTATNDTSSTTGHTTKSGSKTTQTQTKSDENKGKTPATTTLSSKQRSQQSQGNVLSRQEHHSLDKQVAKYMMLTSITASALYCLHVMLMRYHELDWMPYINCLWSIKLQAAIWMLARFSLYAVLTARVGLAFKNSAFAYDARLLRALYCLQAVLLLYHLMLVLLFREGTRTRNAAAGGVNVCSPSGTVALFVTIPIVDWLMSMSMVIMFVRPLLKLRIITRQRSRSRSHSRIRARTCSSRSRGASQSAASLPRKPSNFRGVAGSVSAVEVIEEQQTTTTTTSMRAMDVDAEAMEDMEFELLPLRYMLCAAVALVSTLIYTTLLFRVGMASLGVLDVTLNSCCLLLMTSHFTRSFWLVCQPLLACMAYLKCGLDESTRNAVRAVMDHYQ